ncbi:hypothetical protein [Bacillus inaquosorum]|uniref:hypothetical protein n=1 Tax=Bacillus inaquosorum TaxID=483913 RepID=UPI00227E219C|nr:hypothetical protein [Bacillus inaquosorum]MCY8855358.1 hypothetical protein [Bacillus inaquosorum]
MNFSKELTEIELERMDQYFLYHSMRINHGISMIDPLAYQYSSLHHNAAQNP